MVVVVVLGIVVLGATGGDICLDLEHECSDSSQGQIVLNCK